MKKKIIYILLTAAIAATTFGAGRISKPEPQAINPADVRGWETWESPEEVGLEIQTENGDFVFAKEPYTLNTEWEVME